jgi:membrane-associated protease RseP (regulator of RpoE activity)
MTENIILTILYSILALLYFFLSIKYIKNWKEINRQYWRKNKGLSTQYLIGFLFLFFGMCFLIYATWNLFPINP